MKTKTRIILISSIVVILLIILMVKNKIEMNASKGAGAMTTSPAVSVYKAQKQSIDNRFSLVGTLNGFNDVVVLSETQGRVVKVDAEVGQYKEAGSVLVEVDSETREAAYKAAEVNYEKAKKDLERYEVLYNEHSISDSQIEQARWAYQSADAQYITARRAFTDTKITTPISGIVTARYVNVGTMTVGAPQATQIANIVDISRLKAKVQVAEKDVFRLHTGDAVDITTDVFPKAVFAGKIFTISSKGDDGHTYAVEVLLPNPKLQLKAGMFVHVTFKPNAENNAMIIPRAAIIGSVQNAQVYVVKNNIATLRSILAGAEIGTNVEVLQGLQEGEVVVVDGQNNLNDNIQVVVH
ncbi:MAG TPA: efflux RND transporter periplasmic adaptor subunit [Bacteroidota bacterium]|nr:efflux RND transporter periplasmic adaptor subunit [Bacteroidota bacterium]